jgi:hypothetical protein
MRRLRIEGRITLLLRRHGQARSSGNGTDIRSANNRTLSERGKVLKPARPASSVASRSYRGEGRVTSSCAVRRHRRRDRSLVSAGVALLEAFPFLPARWAWQNPDLVMPPG